MIRLADMLRLGGVALVLSVAIGAGAALAKPAEATLAGTDATVADKGATSEQAAPACARKVKVIYAGYGEADRAGCPTTAAR